MNRLLGKIKRDLEDLPPPPSSTPLSEVLRLITEFTRDVEMQGKGIPGRGGLLHEIKQPQDDFRVAVRKTAPCFVPQYRHRPESELPIGLMAVSAIPCVSVTSASSTSASSTSASPTSTSPTSPFASRLVKKCTRPPFLIGEEVSGEIYLNDGKEVSIDDVLETAEWHVH